MAEAFLKKMGKDRFEVFSAGLEPTQVDPLAIKAMAEKGYDISGQEAKSLDRYLKERFGYLITVCNRANRLCPVFPGVSLREHWPIKDPAEAVGSEEERLNAYREARDELEKRIKVFIDRNDT